jgi:hypothetical protein
MFFPIPARRHVALADDPYEGGPKSETYVDRLEDAAESWADE